MYKCAFSCQCKSELVQLRVSKVPLKDFSRNDHPEGWSEPAAKESIYEGIECWIWKCKPVKGFEENRRHKGTITNEKKSHHYSQYFSRLFLHLKLTHSIYSLSPQTAVMNSSLGTHCLFTVADLGLCYFHFLMGQTSNQDFTYRSGVLTLGKECRLLQRLQQLLKTKVKCIVIVICSSTVLISEPL